jgi:thymidine phosphorylase
VSAGAGVVLHAKPGDQVVAGQPLLELHADEPARFGRALEALEGGYDIAAEAPARTPLILDRIASG